MKKFVSGFISGAILCGAVAFAASYSAETAPFKILVNGREFISDPPALVVEGRTYLPLRAMGDALGIPVNWNEELGQVEVGVVPADNNYLTLDEAVKAILPVAHAEHDTEYLAIVDDYYEILDETDFAYLIAFPLDAAPGIIPGENDLMEWGADYWPYYIIEKGTANILHGGGLQDYWDGMINDILYGDGHSSGSYQGADFE